MPDPRPLLTVRAAALWALLAIAVSVGVAACDEPIRLVVRTQTDSFVQEVRKTVDILLIVDNSCSMIDEQIKLAGNFDSFIEQFTEAEVDYQIGVVTTDMDDQTQAGRLVGTTKIITSDMDDDLARDLFQENVKVCATGSGFERGLAAAEAALSPSFVEAGGPNEGFLRDDAALSIVFVSDEEDGSAKPVGEYLTFFKGLKGDRGYRDDTLINMSAVVGPPPSGCEQPEPFIPDCADGLADDEDGNIDCDSTICASSWWCSVSTLRESSCDDGEDNDGDGASDCADADCAFLDACHEQSCLDGEDNDGDGEVDCDDIDCLVAFPGVCGELSCEDESLFHHGNTVLNFLLDCDDPSCFAHEEACYPNRAEIDFVERCDAAVQLDRWTGSLLESDGPDVDSLDGENELAGCDDPDCATYFLCSADLQIEGHDRCNDCVDNDADGLEDCEDTDCLDSPFCDNPYEIQPGNRYVDVSLRSGGIVTSICAEEFSGLVRELGLNISGLRSIFFLTAWPVVDSLKVYLDEQTDAAQLTDGFDYDPIENRIVFTEEAVPTAGRTVIVTYTRSGTAPSAQSDDPPADEEGE